jgi:predicted nucleotide-binding protein
MSVKAKYYHIQLKYFEKQSSTDAILFNSATSNYQVSKVVQEYDLTEEEIIDFSKQYSNGDAFVCGKWIESALIQEIEIRETDAKNTSIIYGIFQNSMFPLVTRKFIKSPPRKNAPFEQPLEDQTVKKTAKTQPFSKDIFVVHGNDHAPMKELKTILYELGLNPIILHDQPSGGSNTLIEKLERYADVSYAFVILTPDDIGGSLNQLRRSLEEVIKEKGNINQALGIIFDPQKGLKSRSRQNVVLEFGYFINKVGRSRVCCLHKGDVEIPSDMKGIMYISFNDSLEEIRLNIMKELKDAGFSINF